MVIENNFIYVWICFILWCMAEFRNRTTANDPYSYPQRSFPLKFIFPEGHYPIVDSRITNSCSNTMLSTWFPLIILISMLAAVDPILYIGWATVVSVGFVILEKLILSK